MTTELYHDICAWLRDLIRDTRWEGKVFTVGGCCRDSIMGFPIKDVDLAVNTPDGGIDFAMWLYDKGLCTAEPVTFPKYGTARLWLKEFPDDEIELVQTRREKYTDRTSRDPSTVFGSIEDDCYRRDLTINSLYYDISSGKTLDITGRGLADIENRIIRTPSDPDTTFDDDPVRIIRAVRFAAKFGWEIEPQAFEAMSRYASRLSIISPERMAGEFEKAILTPHPAQALDMLRQIGALPYIMPELMSMVGMKQSEYHFGTVWEHTLATVERVPADPLLRMAALLHDIGKIVAYTEDKDGSIRFPGHDRRCAAVIDKTLRRLHYHKPFIDKVIFLCVHHEAAKSWGPDAEKMTDAALRRLQHLCRTPKRLANLLALINADNRSYAPSHCMPGQCDIIRRRSDQLRREGTAMFNYALPIKAARVRRILRLPSEGHTREVENAMSELMKTAYENPRLSREQAATITARLRADISADTGHEPRRRSRRKKKK